MTDHTTQSDGAARLIAAERDGLRLAIIIRTAAVGLAFLWIAGSSALSGFDRLWISPTGMSALAGFTAIGLVHLWLMRQERDPWWLKYAIYTLDMAGICTLFAIMPLYAGQAIPQILVYRGYGVYQLVPVLILSALALSPRLVLWTGGVGVVGWLAAFGAIYATMSAPLSWSDLPLNATGAEFVALVTDLNFAGRGNRISEAGILTISTVALAAVVARARRVFFAQITAEAGRRRIERTLGRYVPAAVANRLIDNYSALAPQERQATILVLDVAGFSTWSAGRAPRDVIAALNAFLARAAQDIDAAGGVVIQYTGDGLLATFGTPLDCDDPPSAAKEAARLLRKIDSAFGIRIGIATGPVASGSIGSSERQAFTVYGETVNRAARLEAAAKDVGVDVLMDAASAGGGAPLTTLDLRGLSQPVDVFTLNT